jgi:hypothetical protein
LSIPGRAASFATLRNNLTIETFCARMDVANLEKLREN